MTRQVNSTMSMVVETVLYFKNGGLDEVLDLLAQCREDKEVRMMMLEGLAGQMLGMIANSNLLVWMRNSWLRTFNMLLPGSNYKLRGVLEREFVENIEQLVDLLYTCGDYDMQSSLVELLLRFTFKANRPKLAMTWFPNYNFVQSLFVRIMDFETDCCNFLQLLQPRPWKQSAGHHPPCPDLPGGGAADVQAP
jgi:hypothetical protein